MLDALPWLLSDEELMLETPKHVLTKLAVRETLVGFPLF